MRANAIIPAEITILAPMINAFFLSIKPTLSKFSSCRGATLPNTYPKAYEIKVNPPTTETKPGPRVRFALDLLWKNRISER